MGRWLILLMAVAVMAFGCSASSSGVGDEFDRDSLDELMRYEIEDEDVSFRAAGVEVHGTVSRPVTDDEVPGVVLIAGSGPTDRDWNNPLLPGDNGTAIELSNSLARAGIATLRYDKRGTGHTEFTGSVAWEDYLAEIQGAVERLEDMDGIDNERILVAGHSEGGAHALRAVVDEWIEVQGVILLATAGRPLAAIVLDQVEEQLEDAGMDEETIDAELGSLKQAMDAISRGESVEAERVSQIPGLVSIVEMLQADDSRDFAAQMLSWDPGRAIAQVRQPVLVVNGKKDIQVSPKEDARRLHDAANGQSDRVRLVLVEDADHVLKYQPAPREELSAQHSLSYNAPARHLDDGVLVAVLSWIYDL